MVQRGVKNRMLNAQREPGLFACEEQPEGCRPAQLTTRVVRRGLQGLLQLGVAALPREFPALGDPDSRSCPRLCPRFLRMMQPGRPGRAGRPPQINPLVCWSGGLQRTARREGKPAIRAGRPLRETPEPWLRNRRGQRRGRDQKGGR